MIVDKGKSLMLKTPPFKKLNFKKKLSASHEFTTIN
jgi:hypothetical protein